MTTTIMTLMAVATGTLWPAGQDEARAYYPSQLGDTWTYESTARGVFINEVVRSTPVVGATIAYIRSTDAAGQAQVLTVRYDGPRVYIAPAQGAEMLLADFGLEEGGSSVDESREATVTLTARHASLEVFGRAFADVVEVEHSMPSGMTMTYYFARGLGMVGNRSRNPDVQVRLVTFTVASYPFRPR